MKTKINIFKDVLESTYAGTSGWLIKAVSGYTKEELELTQKNFLSAHIEEAFIAAKALGIDYEIKTAKAENGEPVIKIIFNQ